MNSNSVFKLFTVALCYQIYNTMKMKAIILGIAVSFPFFLSSQTLTVSFKHIAAGNPYGLTTHFFLPNGLGFFVEGNFMPRDKDVYNDPHKIILRSDGTYDNPYYEQLTDKNWGKMYKSYNFNGGLLWKNSPQTAIQLGAGYYYEQTYRYGYIRNSDTISRSNYVFFDRERRALNVNISCFYYVKRVALGLSFDTAPQRLGISIGYAIIK